jgi:hypothetical protein
VSVRPGHDVFWLLVVIVACSRSIAFEPAILLDRDHAHATPAGVVEPVHGHQHTEPRGASAAGPKPEIEPAPGVETPSNGPSPSDGVTVTVSTA